MKEKPDFFQELLDLWWQRFCIQHRRQILNSEPIPPATARSFCALKMSLRRREIQQLAHYWQRQGLLQIRCDGWVVLQPAPDSIPEYSGKITVTAAAGVTA